MKWPLSDLSAAFVRKNGHQAKLIASQVRAINKAGYAFTRDPSAGLMPNAVGKGVEEVGTYCSIFMRGLRVAQYVVTRTVVLRLISLTERRSRFLIRKLGPRQ